MNTVVAKCPVPHEVDCDGVVVPLEACPLCEGKGEIVVQLTDEELESNDDVFLPLSSVQKIQ